MGRMSTPKLLFIIVASIIIVVCLLWAITAPCTYSVYIYHQEGFKSKILKEYHGVKRFAKSKQGDVFLLVDGKWVYLGEPNDTRSFTIKRVR